MIFPTQALWGANGILKDLGWDILSLPSFQLTRFLSHALGVHNDLHFVGLLKTNFQFFHSSL